MECIGIPIYIIYNREVIYMFIFDYTIKDWKERKDIVDKYIKENKLVEKIEELVVQNTVPKKVDKNGKVSEWYVQGNSELRELELLLNKMYNYILYAIDKSYLTEQKETERQLKALFDNEQGIKSYVDERKRGKYYKEPKWTIIDEDIIKKNQQKRDNFNNDLGKVINSQITEYEKLKEIVSKMSNETLSEMNLKRINIITDLCYDIKICNNCKESLNAVYVEEGIRSKHDKLSDVDIPYNKKVIRNVLSNWNNLQVMAESNPSHYIHAIYMDFGNALNDLNLTAKQCEILYKVMNNEPLLNNEKSNYSFIVDKINKNLNNF